MLFFFITAGSLVKSVGEEQFVPANNSVLNLCLSGNIKERMPRTTTFMPKDETTAMGLDDIIAAIRKAKNDHRIKGIYLNPRIFSASPATLAQMCIRDSHIANHGITNYSIAPIFGLPYIRNKIITVWRKHSYFVRSYC